MNFKKLLAAVAFLVGAALSEPLISQDVKPSADWLVISCNTDGTYTCSNEPCLGYSCCPITAS